MPNKDGTGPEGKGPRTGRQMGSCNDAKPVKGLGPCGQGLRRNLGRRFNRNNQKEE